MTAESGACVHATHYWCDNMLGTLLMQVIPNCQCGLEPTLIHGSTSLLPSSVTLGGHHPSHHCHASEEIESAYYVFPFNDK
jgi:hypothetical protein